MDEKMLENAYPEMHSRIPDRVFTEDDFKLTDLPFDSREIFDHIRDIKDPEHPMSLEELMVVDENYIQVDAEGWLVRVEFRPTIPHCSMATLIGLAVKVQLLRLLPSRFKIDVCILPGTHVSSVAINKQLADKERIAAALENVHLLEVINECLLLPEPQELPAFVQAALADAGRLGHPRVDYLRSSRQHVESYRRWGNVLRSDS